jgi:hypothetical protein
MEPASRRYIGCRLQPQEVAMAAPHTEALVAALEACAEALERRGWASEPASGGSLPRLRPASLGSALGRMAHGSGMRPSADPAPEGPDLGKDAQELAAEFRDLAQEVARGNAGRGWLNSLLGRASRHLDEAELATVRAATLGVL